MRAALLILAKAVAGAAGGALVMIVAGQVVGMFADSCTVVCQPAIAAKLGALSGSVAVFMIKPYRPG
jgi:hypothetical protein